jgi:hypothetical protein
MSTAITHIIACDVMKEELLAVTPQQLVTFHFVSMGLHRWPDKLREELRTVLAAVDGKDQVVLAFGLCGGAVAGLQAPGVPLFIPRAHDCIPLLLGSRYTHEELVREEKGTYFLSGGWMEAERTTLSEYRRVRDKYGEQKAKRVMSTMFDAYRRLTFIHTGHPRETEHLATARELAGLLELEFIVLSGRDAWLRRIVNGPWDGDSFVAIEPEGAVSETDFGVGTAAALQGI